MLKKFKKINWKSLIVTILGIAILLAIVAGTVALIRRDTKTISSFEFKRGALDENGEYVKSDKSIYTENAFDCIGLRVEPDFEFNGTYDVFYYDYNGHFIEKVAGLKNIYDVDYPLAKMARIVIHPEIPADVKAADFKIKFWEVNSYANDIKITVDKDQEWKYETLNLYNADTVVEGLSFVGVHVGDNLSEYLQQDVLGSKATENIRIEYENYDVFVRYNEIRDVTTCGIALTSEDVVTAVVWHNCSDAAEGEWVKLTIEVPEDSGSEYLKVRLPDTAECYIFGYND